MALGGGSNTAMDPLVMCPDPVYVQNPICSAIEV